jgi:hypothetical protein
MELQTRCGHNLVKYITINNDRITSEHLFNMSELVDYDTSRNDCMVFHNYTINRHSIYETKTGKLVKEFNYEIIDIINDNIIKYYVHPYDTAYDTAHDTARDTAYINMDTLEAPPTIANPFAIKKTETNNSITLTVHSYYAEKRLRFLPRVVIDDMSTTISVVTKNNYCIIHSHHSDIKRFKLITGLTHYFTDIIYECDFNPRMLVLKMNIQSTTKSALRPKKLVFD